MTDRDRISVFSVLDGHLSKLDSLMDSPGSIFCAEPERTKGQYETYLTYSFRKYRAAEYHLDNVRKFIAAEADSLEASTEAERLARNGTRAELRVARAADKYVYELAAFLEALKSAVDLLADVCCYCWPDISTRNSLWSLLKAVEAGRRGPVLDEIASNSVWLDALRCYRNQLVHRLMPSYRSGHIIRTMGEHVAKARVPVIVPISTPEYEPDTHEIRMLDGMADTDVGLPGLDIEVTEGKISLGDGTTEVVEFSISLKASPGYSLIDVFMESHLESFCRFFAEVIQALDGLQFRPAPAESRRGN